MQRLSPERLWTTMEQNKKIIFITHLSEILSSEIFTTGVRPIVICDLDGVVFN